MTSWQTLLKSVKYRLEMSRMSGYFTNGKKLSSLFHGNHFNPLVFRASKGFSAGLEYLLAIGLCD
jgi:hypothetical protein